MRFGSLFSGIGGLDLGLEWAGMECAWMVEKDQQCRGWLHQNWPHVRIHDDVTTFDATLAAPVDLICGGFPCQPVSLAGRREGARDTRWLWPVMRDIVSSVRPAWVLGENTPGLITMGLDGVLADLEALGYSCRTFVIPACAVNAPHRRDRVFVVAHTLRSGCAKGEPSDTRQAGRGSLTGDGSEGGLADAALRGRDGVPGTEPGEHRGPSREAGRRGVVCRLAHSGHDHAIPEGHRSQGQGGIGPAGFALDGGGMGNAHGAGLPTSEQPGEPGEAECGMCARSTATQPSDAPCAWADAEWLMCADGKARRVKPGVRLLAHGIPGRVARLKALGNAVVPQVAYEIGRAIMAAGGEGVG